MQRLFKLDINSLHLEIGANGETDDIVRSDTLFSAIVEASRKLHGRETADYIIELANNGGIKITSAFPFFEDELFFPLPLNLFVECKDYVLQKEFKKIRFISYKLWERLRKGENAFAQYGDYERFKNLFSNGCLFDIEDKAAANGNAPKIYEKIEVPHTVIDRITNGTNIFYKTELWFNKNAGLFFIADVHDDFMNKFESIVSFLGDEGIGADRTSGKGFFKLKTLDFEFGELPNSDSILLLSLYLPTKEEIENIVPHKSYYKLLQRKGWISNSTLNRKSTFMLTEGSTMKLKNSAELKGEAIKVLSKENYPELDFDIYRSGIAFGVPVFGGENEYKI